MCEAITKPMLKQNINLLNEGCGAIGMQNLYMLQNEMRAIKTTSRRKKTLLLKITITWKLALPLVVSAGRTI